MYTMTPNDLRKEAENKRYEADKLNEEADKQELALYQAEKEQEEAERQMAVAQAVGG